MKPGKEIISETLFRETCYKYNLRVTPQRLVIYKMIHGSKEHPNADVIYRKAKKLFSSISFDTVNRTLLTFARIGILKVVEGFGYPKRFDPDLENHHHFHCLKCNCIIDFYEESFNTLKIPESISQGNIVTGKKVVLEGICYNCK